MWLLYTLIIGLLVFALLRKLPLRLHLYSQPNFSNDRFKKESLDEVMEDYNDYYTGKKNDVDVRKTDHKKLSITFYDVATEFYELGWGDAFHFAPRFLGETLNSSIRRYESWLAAHARISKGMKVMDAGCGVGGPAIHIAMTTEAEVVGINTNVFQIGRARKRTEAVNLQDRITYVEADFNFLPFDDNTFDAVYSVEAICYSSDKVKTLKEWLRVLKPGGYMSLTTWQTTPEFDPNNKEHQEIKQKIEQGVGLPYLAEHMEIVHAAKEAGFDVLYHKDPGQDPQLGDPIMPWYHPLGHFFSFTWEGFTSSRLSRMITSKLVVLLEWSKLAPKGTVAIHKLLEVSAQGLVDGGKTGTFIPYYLLCARKPL